jgi:uncharacterized membrane protein HdeD (DUF308 family)
MALIFVRAIRPDANVWPGRRLLAALDAVAWPGLWICATLQAPFETGVTGKVIVGLAVVIAGDRSIKALFRNERYRFSTWRWGRFAVALLLLGFVLKLTVA